MPFVTTYTDEKSGAIILTKGPLPSKKFKPTTLKKLHDGSYEAISTLPFLIAREVTLNNFLF